eukprot:11193017-Lingulodinium_polyedra.AAC.1
MGTYGYIRSHFGSSQTQSELRHHHHPLLSMPCATRALAVVRYPDGRVLYVNDGQAAMALAVEAARPPAHDPGLRDLSARAVVAGAQLW